MKGVQEVNTMNDNIEQRCYLQYLLSKYVSNPCRESQGQELETQYNAVDWIFETPSVAVTAAEQ